MVVLRAQESADDLAAGLTLQVGAGVTGRVRGVLPLDGSARAIARTRLGDDRQDDRVIAQIP